MGYTIMEFMVSITVCAGLVTKGVYVSTRVMELDEGVVKKLEPLLSRCSEIRQTSKEWKFEGKWLRAGNINYISREGVGRVWETVERTTQPFGNVDGADIIGRR